MTFYREDSKSFSVQAIWPQWHLEVWVSYTLKCVIESMSSNSVRCGITAISKSRRINHDYVDSVFHSYIFKYLNRIFNLSSNINLSFAITVWRAKWRLKINDVAYFWLGSPYQISYRLRSEGIMVAREMINCTLKKRRSQLAAAYNLLGLADGSGISDQDIETERQDLLSVDVIFCPNPQVKASVVDYGFPESNCIDTSYGWETSRLAQKNSPIKNQHSFTVAFVGTVDIRKGAPWMLEAWKKAGIQGQLLLAGRISNEVESLYQEILSREDVVCLGHVDNIGEIYEKADVFCMPTWEEGGPLVTLEAMSAGCVPVVTDMGSAGAFTEYEEIGIVVPPGDVDAICKAFQLLSSDRDKLKIYSERAANRALNYTWEKVGAKRREKLKIQRENWILQGRKHWSEI